MLASAVLEGAAAKIEKDGWAKERFGYVDGPNCAAGAIYYVSLHSHRYSLYGAHRWLCKFIPKGTSIPTWNDEALDQEEVVDTLRKASQAAKDAGS